MQLEQLKIESEALFQIDQVVLKESCYQTVKVI